MKKKIKVWITNIREDRLSKVSKRISLHEIIFDAIINHKEKLGIYRKMSPSEYKSVMDKGYFTVDSEKELIENTQYKDELRGQYGISGLL